MEQCGGVSQQGTDNLTGVAKRVVAVKPVLPVRGGDYPELVAAVPAVVPLLGPKARLELAFADKPSGFVVVVAGIPPLADPPLLPLGVLAVGQWQALPGVATLRLLLAAGIRSLAEGFQHPAAAIEPVALPLSPAPLANQVARPVIAVLNRAAN